MRNCLGWLRLGWLKIHLRITGPKMDRPKWVEIIKHLKLNGNHPKRFIFVSGPHKNYQNVTCSVLPV